MRSLDLGALDRDRLLKLELHYSCRAYHLRHRNPAFQSQLLLLERVPINLRVWSRLGIQSWQLRQRFLPLRSASTLWSFCIRYQSHFLFGPHSQALKKDSCSQGRCGNYFVPRLGDCPKFLAILGRRSLLCFRKRQINWLFRFLADHRKIDLARSCRSLCNGRLWLCLLRNRVLTCAETWWLVYVNFS